MDNFSYLFQLSSISLTLHWRCISLLSLFIHNHHDHNKHSFQTPLLNPTLSFVMGIGSSSSNCCVLSVKDKKELVSYTHFGEESIISVYLIFSSIFFS
jgi:hypothetical protein